MPSRVTLALPLATIRSPDAVTVFSGMSALGVAHSRVAVPAVRTCPAVPLPNLATAALPEATIRSPWVVTVFSGMLAVLSFMFCQLEPFQNSTAVEPVR